MDMRTALADPQPEPLVRRVALQMAELRKADPLQSKFHPARLARPTDTVELRRALAAPQREPLVRQVALHMDMTELRRDRLSDPLQPAPAARQVARRGMAGLRRAGPLQSKFRPAQLA